MHILSKILLGLAIVLALVAVVPMGKLAVARNKLSDEIVKQKKLRDENIEKIAKARITRGNELDELNRQMESWGRQWVAKGQKDGTQPTILLNIGMPQGLAAQQVATKRPLPSVHLFHIQPEGSVYLGEFNVDQPGQQTLLTLARPAYPGQVDSWPAEGDFRVRERIPPGTRAIFHDLFTQQAIADQQVVNETAKGVIQDNHIAASQKTLDQRLAELNGNPAAPQTADPEIVSGLVETLRREEAERNTVLQDVDALRRSLSDSYARLQSVLAENGRAVDSLTSAVGTETAAKPERVRAN